MRLIKLRLGLVQQSNTPDIQSNISKLIANIRWCADKGSQLVVLPELHNSLYFCQTENIKTFDISESIPGHSTRLFGKLAQELGIILVLSLFERRTAGLYHNTAVVIEKDGNIVGRYRKMHIPDDPSYYEKFYFTPGDLGFQPIQTSLGKLGILICWDQWYPEAARLMTLYGSDILIYPTAIGYESSDTDEEKKKQKDAWIISQQAHAIHNGLPVVAVNRVGHENDPSEQTNGILFWGNSFVCGAQGEIIVQASDTQEENLIVDINLHKQEDIRRAWPFLRDRRIDAYENLTRRFIDQSQPVSEIVQKKKKPITLEKIQNIVSSYFKINIDQIHSKSRQREIVQARQIIMFLSKKHTNHSYSFIGEQIGKRNQATVLHACKAIQNNLCNNKGFFYSMMKDIETSLLD